MRISPLHVTVFFIIISSFMSACNREQNASWGRSPVMSRPASPRAYDRRKARKGSQDDPYVLSFFPHIRASPRVEYGEAYFFSSPGRKPKLSRKARWNTE